MGWGNANTSYGYGHPDVINLPGGSDCNPVRFETIVEPTNNDRIDHAGVDDDEMFEDELDDDEDALLAMSCEGYENDPVRVAFNEYIDDVVRDLERANSETEFDNLFNVSFDELEDSASEVESEFDDLFNVSFDELEESVSEVESVVDPEIYDLFNESFDEMDTPELESGEDPFNESLDISVLDDETRIRFCHHILFPLMKKGVQILRGSRSLILIN